MKKILTLILASLITACTVHKAEIQQGNVLTAQMVDGIKPGMDKKQVKFLLGTPPINDPFHPQRWDYIYTQQEHGKPLSRYHVVVFFDVADKVEKIETRQAPPAEIPVRQ